VNRRKNTIKPSRPHFSLAMPALFPRGVGPSVASIQPRLVYPRLSPFPLQLFHLARKGSRRSAGAQRRFCPRVHDAELRLSGELLLAENRFWTRCLPSFPGGCSLRQNKPHIGSVAASFGLILAKMPLASGKVFSVNDLCTHLLSAPGPQLWKPSRLERPP
jgi:hypothetical protein